MAALLLACGGCGSDERAADTQDRPTSVIHEQTEHVAPAQDVPFQSLEVKAFRTNDVLSDLDVRALAFAGDELWVGTASGAAKLRSDGTGFTDVALDTPGAVVDLVALDAGKVVVAKADRIVIVGSGPPEVWPVAGQKVSAVAVHAGDVLLGSELGVSSVSGSGTTPIAALQGVSVRDLAVGGDTLYVATGAGALRFDLAKGVPLSPWNAPGQLPDDDVRAIAVGSDGATVFAGTATGYARSEPNAAPVIEVAGLGALATGGVRAIAGRGGTLLLGHEIGLSEVTGATRRHLHGERWIGAETVTSVAIASDGTRFVGTPGGVSRHGAKSQTLAEKADAFEAMTDQYLRMDGFMSNEVFRSDPWNPSEPVSRTDNDNDGLWTQMQIAAWCFAYATTKDEKYYLRARRSLDVMLLQIDVPGASFENLGKPSGFITRSLVRSDEGALFDQKQAKSNWHLQEYQGATYYWKDDTSADEYTGHFFGLPIYYDLCARDPDERARIAEHVDRAMGYLVDNGYRLIDLDGEPTTHGDWTGLANAVDGLGACIAKGLPKCAAAYGGEGWLNSIQILGFLLASWHVTGNDRYYREYLELAVNQRYAEMVTPLASTLTLTSPKLANHSDHELATLAYFTLLRYEPDPERRETYLNAIREFFTHEKRERNALELGLMAGALEDVDADVAAKTLREIPMDRRSFLLDNSHRKDAKLSPDPDRFDAPQFESVFPYDEIGELEWNGNLLAVVQGADGRPIQGVWPFLLPYWSLRYFRALE
ncbi:MAG: hypothetical protein U0263_22455 [Polyangiaceae bacterium]